MLDDFVELHGDRLFGDDKAIVTGLATMKGVPFMLIGHRKGKTVKDRLACNFGCAHPEGYRKALAKMRLAEKLGLPIVTFINTPGAYPGIGAEERGQAGAIATNILEMFSVEVPIIALVIGEGGSGGALGIGVGDRVGMLEHAYYSVISPEGCAAILWKSGEKTPEAAEALRLTSSDLLGMGLVDEVVEEPLGGAPPRRADDDRERADADPGVDRGAARAVEGRPGGGAVREVPADGALKEPRGAPQSPILSGVPCRGELRRDDSWGATRPPDPPGRRRFAPPWETRKHGRALSPWFRTSVFPGGARSAPTQNPFHVRWVAHAPASVPDFPHSLQHTSRVGVFATEPLFRRLLAPLTWECRRWIESPLFRR